MLFQIDESVSELFFLGSPTPQDFTSLGYLLLGATEGNHRVTGSRSVLRKLSEVQSLESRAKRTLERALARIAQEGHLPRRLRTIGLVVANASTIPSAHTSGSQQVITFPLRWFDRSARVQPVTLLGENLADVNVCKILGEVGVALDGIGYLPFSFSSGHGGGSTIGMVLGHYASIAQLCICVVDSDKSSPTSVVGATANGVAQYKNKQTYPLIQVLETSGRDIENLLPDLFYTTTYGRSPIYGPLAQLLSALTSRGDVETRAHLDIKKGLVLHDILNLPANSHEQQFWTGKEQIIFPLIGGSVQSLPCHNLPNCPHTGRNQCTCVIVRGITAGILDDFVNFGQGKDRFAQKNELDDSVRQEWLRLGTELGSWCCGDDRLRV